MKHLTKHESQIALDAIKAQLAKPQVAVIADNNGVVSGSIYYGKYVPNYLSIESLEDNNIIFWKANNSSISKTISVSTDNGETWTDKTSDTTGVTLATLNTGNKLLVKGSNAAYGNNNSDYHNNSFASTGNFNVSGNIMSMIYEDNFAGQTTLDSTGYNFTSLFINCNKLISAENLILPATTLTRNCYSKMFYGCTSLTTAPELPATTLAQECYSKMFYGCTSLTTAPELSVTTLANWCYYYMFYGCAVLTTAPELPATTLTERCYEGMFSTCTSLNYVKCLATSKSASYCTSGWLANVASKGTFIKAASVYPSWTTGVSGIPSGWTTQTAA